MLLAVFMIISLTLSRLQRDYKTGNIQCWWNEKSIKTNALLMEYFAIEKLKLLLTIVPLWKYQTLLE